MLRLSFFRLILVQIWISFPIILVWSNSKTRLKNSPLIHNQNISPINTDHGKLENLVGLGLGISLHFRSYVVFASLWYILLILNEKRKAKQNKQTKNPDLDLHSTAIVSMLPWQPSLVVGQPISFGRSRWEGTSNYPTFLSQRFHRLIYF